MTEKLKRIRRTPVEARRVILDAAERRLAEFGPEGIRLQDIAADVGISHPTILHHFDSREGLVLALTHRTTEQLRAELLAAFSVPQARDADIHPILDRVFDVLSRQGHARLVGWMILGGVMGEQTGPGMLKELTDLIHGLRSIECGARNLPVPNREDTLFIVMLGAITAFGDGLFGPLVRSASGAVDDKTMPKRFRAWFAKLLRGQIFPPAE